MLDQKKITEVRGTWLILKYGDLMDIGLLAEHGNGPKGDFIWIPSTFERLPFFHGSWQAFKGEVSVYLPCSSTRVVEYKLSSVLDYLKTKSLPSNLICATWKTYKEDNDVNMWLHSVQTTPKTHFQDFMDFLGIVKAKGEVEYTDDLRQKITGLFARAAGIDRQLDTIEEMMMNDGIPKGVEARAQSLKDKVCRIKKFRKTDVQIQWEDKPITGDVDNMHGRFPQQHQIPDAYNSQLPTSIVAASLAEMVTALPPDTRPNKRTKIDPPPYQPSVTSNPPPSTQHIPFLAAVPAPKSPESDIAHEFKRMTEVFLGKYQQMEEEILQLKNENQLLRNQQEVMRSTMLATLGLQ